MSRNHFKINKGVSLGPVTSRPSDPENGDMIYNNTNAVFERYEAGGWKSFSSGSSGGAVNLITNGDAESAISSIFTPYADAAASRPVDGTGGSPTVTTSLTSTNPLTGVNSYLLTKPASNTQGQGWSISSFTVNPSYRAKVLKIDIDYIINTGTFVAGVNGSSPSDSDVIFYLYDITNSQLIEPSNIKLFSNSTTISDKYQATFQTSATGSSYRLIAHCASTSSLAYELKVDNVSVSPSTYVFGSPVTDWASYTPTFVGLGSVTVVESFWRRVGDSIQIRGRATLGTTTGVLAKISFPAGLAIDNTKNTIQTLIGGDFSNNSTGQTYQVLINPTENSILFTLQTLSAVTGTTIGSSGNTVGWASGLIPILGLSSSVQMSDSADTRVVAMQNTGSATATVTSSYSLLKFTSSPTNDTHGAYSSSTGLYTTPSSGYYRFSSQVQVSATYTATNIAGLGVAKNGIVGNIGIQVAGGATANLYPELNTTVFCIAGDTLAPYIACNATSPTIVANNNVAWFNVEKISGPSAIAATEEISCRYTSSSGQVITNSQTTYLYGIKNYDTHGAYNTSTGVFTAPSNGNYEVFAQIYDTQTASANDIYINIVKNSVNYASNLKTTAAGTAGSVSLSSAIQLLAGESFNIQVRHSVATSNAAIVDATFNFLSIKRIK